LDPGYPAERLATMLTDSGAALVITSSGIAPTLPDTTPRLLLEAFGDEAPDESEFEPARPAGLTPQSIAYIIYTSGSTGRPKGVAMPHASLANLAAARLRHDPIGPGARVLAALSVSFDVSVGQLLTPLLSGAAVVVASELNTLSGAEFWRLLADEGVTHVNSGPSFIDAILDEAPAGLPLQRLMLGGEPLSTGLIQRLRRRLPGVEIFNMYGPTETCIDATCYRVSGDETGANAPIGRPLPNYRAYILDSHGQPVGVGLVGELHIGGASLARGYLNRPDLTLERFIPDPFGAPGGRLYRTGDLARWRADGEIEFAGRIDTQVKIRGFRIEPGEIEAALLALPEVVSAAVVARPHKGHTRLVAYLVAPAGRPPLTAIELKRRLASNLPEAMIPQAFVWLDALPVTRNAKLDKAALPEPHDEGEGRTTFVAPTTELERRLQAIWQDLLAKDPIGIDDNFFELGGHSLTALRLVAACRAKLDLDLPVTAVFAHQTIRALAAAAGSGAESGPLLTLRGGGTRPPLFCVHPVGGSALVYRPLAEALGADQPVHGLQALGQAPAESIEAMARTYVAAIRQVQPQGPYHLLGHSFGGLLAFEMARRLESEGETVAQLTLLDTSITETAAPDADDDTIRRLLCAEAGASGELEASLDEDITRLVRHHVRLSAGYAPTELKAPLTYVRALGDGREDGRETYWTALSRQPGPVLDLPCGHFDMLSAEPAEALARSLTQPLGAS
jgi:amino acid adenylation domain-containing protein